MTTVIARFQMQVERAPHDIAVECGARSLTYRELDELSSHLARWWIARFGDPGPLVGVCMPRDLELILAYLAILKIGAAYVPLDASYPADRLELMVRDAGLTTVLVDRASLLDQLDLGVRLIDVTRVSRAPDDPTLPDPGGADDPIYVIYTSGSTGRPKGVVVRQASVLSLVVETDYVCLSASDRVLQISNVSFDASTFEIWGALLNGARLVIIPGTVLGAEELAPHLAHGDATLFLTTALFNDLGPALRGAGHVLFGGERCDLAYVRAAVASGGIRRLSHVYGPTECTTFATHHPVESDDLRGGALPIGRGIRRTELYVLDPDLSATRPGELGELYLGGDGLATGYLRRPALTAERFVPDGISGQPGRRLYRTGDLVRVREDGALEFHGRTDHQVKLRGFRIEPGEIERRLTEHPEVDHAVVLLRHDRAGIAELVAYVAARARTPRLAARLRHYVGDALPGYMVPAAVVVMERLPLNLNGKVDRDALPPPVFDACDDIVQPSTPTERELVAIWQEVLRLTQVSVTTHFLELGGQSLLAARIAAQVGQRLGVDLPVGLVFQHPTVRGLAQAIDAGQARSATAPVLARAEASRRSVLSSGQARLWFLDQAQRGSAHYNIPWEFELAGELRLDALQRALDRVLERHESLRTVYLHDRGRPRQVVRRAQAAPLSVHDLGGMGGPAQAQVLAELRYAEQTAPFDLREGPLLRARVACLAPRSATLWLTVHHIAADGWSMGLLMKELNALYAHEGYGADLALPGLPIQFADYAAWEHDWLQSPALEERIAFWRTRLGGAPASHALALDHPRPQTTRHGGRTLFCSLSRCTATALEACARRHDATLFMVMSTAFAALLSRWTGEDDIVFGIPVANRNNAQLAPLIGFFVNTVVERVTLTRGQTFAEALRATRARALESAEHGVPFEVLVDQLQPQRSSQLHPFFQVMFVFHNNDESPLALRGLECRAVPADPPFSKFDLTLSLTPAPDGMTAAWEYSTELFDQATIGSLSDSFAALVEHVVRDDECRIGELDLVAPALRRAAIELGTRDADRVQRGLVHAMFEQQARRTPHALASWHRDEGSAYVELDTRATLIAGHLQRAGVGRGDVVALCMDRTHDLVEGMLGILKAGAAYLPLDPAVPAQRLQMMLADAAVRVLVSKRQLQDRLRLDVAVVLRVEEPLESVPFAAPPLSTDDLAYVIYTSGSTGRPKGVDMTHGVLSNLIASMRAHESRLQGQTTLVQFASLGFDMSFTDVFLALSSGGAVIHLDHAAIADPSILAGVIEDRQAGAVNLPYAALQSLASVTVARNRPLPCLKVVISTAEQLKITAEIRAFFQLNPGCRLVNHYGPSETHVVTAHGMPGLPVAWQFLPPIGRPVDGVTAFVLDPQGDLVPPGMMGELFVGGACEARGYRGRGRGTAERWIPDPWSGRPGARLYRTGDRVRWRGDGTLEYHGRFDQQLKLRGFRIEPSEIELQLTGHPSVAAALVLLREDAAGVARLVAHVVLTPAQEGTPQHWRVLCQHLARALPSYMVPSACVFMDAFPLNVNGKVDRSRLPQPRLIDDAADREVHAPSTATERLVAGVWAELLDRPSIDAASGFFECGGNSLLAVRAAIALGRAMSMEVPVMALFEYPSVRELAGELDRWNGSDRALDEIPRLPHEGSVPASRAQRRVWIAEQRGLGNSAYNLPIVIDLAGPLDAVRLVDAIARVMERHMVFRATLALEGDQLRMITRGGAPQPLPVHDVVDGADLDEATRAVTEPPFDLRAGPLWRGVVLHASDRHRLVLCIHHIIFDAWSCELFFSEISALYRGVAPPDASPRQYAELAAWEATQPSEPATGSLPFWEEHLTGVPAETGLPHDYQPTEEGQRRGAMVSILVDAGVWRAAQRECAAREVTPFVFLLALYVSVLTRHNGEVCTCVGIPVAGRSRPETMSMLGLFVNMLPLHLEVSPGQPFMHLLQVVQSRWRSILPFQDTPFDSIVGRLAPSRSHDGAPFFSTTFGLNPSTEAALHLDGVKVQLRYHESKGAKFDLSVACEPEQGGLRVYAAYDDGLYDRETILRFLDVFDTTLRAACRAAD